jgi:hypothetical protein
MSKAPGFGWNNDRAKLYVKIVAARIFSFHEKMAPPTRICLIETDNNHPSHAYLSQ